MTVNRSKLKQNRKIKRQFTLKLEKLPWWGDFPHQPDKADKPKFRS